VIPELDIICRKCKRPVHGGCLWVSFDEIRTLPALHSDWEDQRAASAVTLESLGDMPAEIAWKVHHDGCTPELEDAYSVEATQVSTWAALTSWTSHLMSKNWFAYSDWDEVLREAAGESTEAPRIVARQRSVA
jgi:hypothetical protein